VRANQLVPLDKAKPVTLHKELVQGNPEAIDEVAERLRLSVEVVSLDRERCARQYDCTVFTKLVVCMSCRVPKVAVDGLFGFWPSVSRKKTQSVGERKLLEVAHSLDIRPPKKV